MDLVKTPGAILRTAPLWIVWGVYCSTYIAANSIDVYNERKHVSAANGQMIKLGLVTAVNMGASIAKDVIFAKLFGKKEAAGAAAKSVPMATYAAFLGRDVLTIAGGCILPPYVSKAMQASTGFEKKHADKIAQLTTPMAMQLVCTPLHLVALNFYNTPVATLGERVT